MEASAPRDHPQLLIVDDCRLYREGLEAILVRRYGDDAIRTAHDLPSMRRALAAACPDIILLNLASFDSRALMRAGREHNPPSRLIVLGVCEDDEGEIVACAEAGVSGYHLRTGSLADLIELIASVLDGGSLCSPRITALLMRRLEILANDGRSDRKELVLTGRESQIVEFLELGLSNSEIAERLSIEVATVKNHVHSLLAKVGVRRRAHVAAVLRGRRTAAELPG
jgi:DNA-binding NarL/FixJ family response regulator